MKSAVTNSNLTTQVADNTLFTAPPLQFRLTRAKGRNHGYLGSRSRDHDPGGRRSANSTAGSGRPGHIFPIAAKKGGVLVRPGQTEASVDLARIAGLYPAGVICEIMK